MRRVIIKKIADSHRDGRTWMVMLPNAAGWWLHLYLRSFTEAMGVVTHHQTTGTHLTLGGTMHETGRVAALIRAVLEAEADYSRALVGAWDPAYQCARQRDALRDAEVKLATELAEALEVSGHDER